jgi:hypothetical protein
MHWCCADAGAVSSPLSALMRLLLWQLENELGGICITQSKMCRTFYRINTHGLPNLCASATDPVSLNFSINCRSLLRCGTWGSGYISANFCLTSPIRYIHLHNEPCVPLQTLGPEVATPFLQHPSTPKELTVYGTIVCRKVKLQEGKAIPVDSREGP